MPITELNQTVIEYDYDPLYRLTAADYSNGDYYHYTYDAVVNRTQLTYPDGHDTNKSVVDLHTIPPLNSEHQGAPEKEREPSARVQTEGPYLFLAAAAIIVYGDAVKSQFALACYPCYHTLASEDRSSFDPKSGAQKLVG